MLIRLLYFSENALGFGNAILPELRNILESSKRNNQAAGITGALVFDGDWFVQALEGERDKVWHTLRRLEDDDRHNGIVVIEAKPIESRIFGNWWMRLATRSDQTEAVFAHHLRNGLFQPKNMTPDAVVDLMTALCGTGISRKLVVRETDHPNAIHASA